MPKLFVVDFDQTITAAHTHNQIITSGVDQTNKEACYEIVKDVPLIGSKEAWKVFFKAAAQQGHHVCIASFNAFGFIIPKFLEKMGLTDGEIAKIGIIAGFPCKTEDRESKNDYIKTAIAHATKKGFSGTMSDVILIDDSKKNIEAAKQAGYQVIHAQEDASHLTELQNKLGELKKREEKAPAVDRNTKPKKQLSESELLKSKIKTLKKQREALVKQKKEYLEKINIDSNNKTILFNDPKLEELDLVDNEKCDQLLNAKKQLSKLQSQTHNDKLATVSKKVIEQSLQCLITQLKQEIENYENIKEKNIEKISQLLCKKNLSSEENLTLSSLKSDFFAITEVIKVKGKCLGKIENRDALAVDRDSQPKLTPKQFSR